MWNLSMCRLCLATDVRLCSIARCQQDMYEKLTELTFQREDGRSLLACYICHAKLQNCYQLRTSCLRSEELLTEMLTSGELVPQHVSSTNTLRMVSVVHFSLGHELQDTTECHIKEEAPEVIHDAELEQWNTEDIKMEPQEEHDTQIDAVIQYSHLDDRLNVIKRELDVAETDVDDIKLEKEDIIIVENMPNGSYQSSLSAYNICPKIAKVALKRMVLNKTIPATGVPVLKKLAENDSLLVAKPINVNKNIIVDKQYAISKIQKNDATLQKQTSKSNICSIKKCFRSKTYLESHTRSKHDSTRHMYTHTDAEDVKLKREDTVLEENEHNGAVPPSQSANNICPKIVKVVLERIDLNDPRTGVPVLQKLAKTDSYLVKDPEDHIFNKNIDFENSDEKVGASLHIQINNKAMLHYKGYEQTFKNNICSINQSCCKSKDYLEFYTCTRTGEKWFQCDACTKCFKDRSSFRKHMYIHSNEKRFQCGVCNKYFKSKQYLTLHMYIHTGENQFPCDVCNKYFKSKQYLTRHMHLHTGEKRFRCNVCKKYYWNKYYFSEHMYTHTDKKRFQCDECNRGFSHKCNLRRHLITHTDEKRFQCDVCNKCFREKNKLTRHMKIHTLV